MHTAFRFLKLLFILSFVWVQPHFVASNIEGDRMVGDVKVFKDESECISQGGLCVHTRDCLERHPSSGLCPLNAAYGVECCYRIPIRPAPCRNHLGECMERCNPIIQRPATDCLSNQVCCVLV